jgi:fatty acid desaturase
MELSSSLFYCAANEQGADEDIATDPFLFQWAPDPSQDSPLRKIQHIIFPVAFSFMFALWRFDSLKVTIDAVEKKRTGAKAELYSLLAHYFLLFSIFPVVVWVPAVFMSGLVSALIVTPTHQSEEMFDEYQPDWVTAQFMSTRNAVTTNPVSEWIWGGMQYQLEHHLFPSMPRNNVSQVIHSKKEAVFPHCIIIARLCLCVPFLYALSSHTQSFLPSYLL